MFIEYQVPTDLLTFAGGRGGEVKEPALAVEAVKGHVASLKKMIEESKAAELEDQERKAHFEKARALHDMACSATVELQSAPRKCAAHPPPPSMPLSASSASQTQREGQETTEQKLDMSCDDQSGAADTGTVDVTTVPRKWDARLEALDKDSAVRPTTIKAGEAWAKCSLPHLLGKPVSAVLDSVAQEAEKNKAFDLLDALSLSGALAIEGAESRDDARAALAQTAHATGNVSFQIEDDKRRRQREEKIKRGVGAAAEDQGRAREAQTGG